MVQPTPEAAANCPPTEIPSTPTSTHERLVIPELEEYAEVSTRTIETGAVRLTKHVQDVERTFQPALTEQHVRIDRVPINRVLKNPPEVRVQGDTTIIPVVEEVMVKMLILREELHVTRESVRKPSEPQHVTLRREKVTVERIPSTSEESSPPGHRPD